MPYEAICAARSQVVKRLEAFQTLPLLQHVENAPFRVTPGFGWVCEENRFKPFLTAGCPWNVT